MPRTPPLLLTAALAAVCCGAGVWGVVRLRAVLASDGAVRHVFVVKGLPHGLTEECVAAAKGMTFTPAVREGRPVSQFVMLEYNFDIY